MSFLLMLPLWSDALAGQVRFSGEGHAQNPTWSMDGRYVAFEVNKYDGAGVDMYVAEVSGDMAAKDAVRVALPGGGSAFGGSGQVVLNPSWGKEGYVLFEASNQGGNFRIYYHRSTGGSPSELISTSEIPGDLTFPSFSADAKKIVFVADQTGNGDIRIRDVQTSKNIQLTETNAAEMFPQFNADGSKILYTRKHDGGEDVYEIPAVPGGAETAVAGGTGDQTRPTYAADGYVAYFDGGRGEDHWDLVAVANGAKRVLAKDVRLPVRGRPALSPDGQWLAYTWNDPVKGDRVVLTKVDGSKTVEVPTQFTACAEPAIAQAGGKTVVAFTALPSSGANWRFLYLMDVTDRL
ncbi:MAG: PD40 domain-containing protein [Alphaproteobacteria bacterium]|nr:PD40 domain-containing protein [Alphaproteobacteria bacterium]MCB9696514.1 PD40 domain-containing protein [Alphaproteobacteria bacterium]